MEMSYSALVAATVVTFDLGEGREDLWRKPSLTADDDDVCGCHFLLECVIDLPLASLLIGTPGENRVQFSELEKTAPSATLPHWRRRFWRSQRWRFT